MSEVFELFATRDPTDLNLQSMSGADHRNVGDGIASMVHRMLETEAKPSHATLKRRAAFCLMAVEKSCVAQEAIAQIWSDGARHYRPDQRIVLMYILIGHFRFLLTGDHSKLADISTIMRRGAAIGWTRSESTIRGFIKTGALEGWWDLEHRDNVPGRQGTVTAIRARAGICNAALSAHISALGHHYARAKNSTSLFDGFEADAETLHMLKSTCCNGHQTWAELGLDLNVLQRIENHTLKEWGAHVSHV